MITFNLNLINIYEKQEIQKFFNLRKQAALLLQYLLSYISAVLCAGLESQSEFVVR